MIEALKTVLTQVKEECVNSTLSLLVNLHVRCSFFSLDICLSSAAPTTCCMRYSSNYTFVTFNCSYT
jgi:hypothetical protein